MNNDYKTTFTVDLGFEVNSERPISSYSIMLNKAKCEAPHQHPRAQIIYCDQGIMKVVTSGSLWIVNPSQGIWIAGDIEHQVFFPDKAHVNTVFIDPSVAHFLPQTSFAFTIEPFFRSLLLKMVSFPDEALLSAQQERLHHVFIDELSSIVPAASFLPLSNEPRIARVLNSMQLNKLGELSIEHYAKIACISSRSLSRLFLKELGMTFTDWRVRLKLLQAIKKLEQGYSVKLIALELGYENPASFIYTFKKHFGTTPGRYFTKSRFSPV